MATENLESIELCASGDGADDQVHRDCIEVEEMHCWLNIEKVQMVNWINHGQAPTVWLHIPDVCIHFVFDT